MVSENYPDGPIIFEPIPKDGATAVQYARKDPEYLLGLNKKE
jgi:hypothetical protein